MDDKYGNRVDMGSSDPLEPPSFEPSQDDEVYGRMERQVAFKLLAAHGMMDRKFFDQMRKDPEAAAAMLHVRLNKQDIAYIRDTVNWAELEKHWDGVRDAIQPEAVVRSLW